MRQTPAHWARTPWRRRVVTASPDERQETHAPPRRGGTRAPPAVAGRPSHAHGADDKEDDGQ